MKSNKQRKFEIKALRLKKKRVAIEKLAATVSPSLSLAGQVLVDVAKLAPNNSYGTPSYVLRGFYLDLPFTCKGCGAEELWTAAQQKWWYEVAQGNVNACAVRCKLCRHKETARKVLARKTHLEGLMQKNALKLASNLAN